MIARPFLFVYASSRGPVVKRFADSFALAGYVMGFVTHTGNPAQWDTPRQARGAL